MNEVPSSIWRALETAGLSKQAVIRQAHADMNADCQYQDYFLFLTQTQVAVVTCAISARAMVFAGYPAAAALAPTVERVDIYDIAQLSDPELNNLVSGGELLVKVDGQLKPLCCMTNTRKSQCAALVSALEKRCKGEPLPDREDNEERFCPMCGTAYPEEGRSVCLQCVNRSSLFVRTLGYFKPYKRRFIGLFFCVLGMAVLNITFPYLAGNVLYDKVLARDEGFARAVGVSSPYTQLALLVLSMVAIRTISQLLFVIQGRVTAKIVPYVVQSIKCKTFAALEKLSISFFAKRQTGGLMTRVLEDAEQVAGFFIDGLPQLFIHGLTILASCGFMLAINWKLGLATIAVLPLLLLIHLWLGPIFWNMVGRRHRARRALTSQVNDNITGARVVKAFGQQDTEMNRFAKTNNRLRGAELSLVKVDSLYTAFYIACHAIVTVTIWSVGSLLVLKKQPDISFGVLITFVNYGAMLGGPLEFMSYVVRWWADSMNGAARIFEIIDHQPDVVESFNPVPMKQMQGSVELKNVTFGYNPHTSVLKNVSLKVKAGQVLGVVGKSGAGKSTLVNLISRLYDASEGEVLIDGVNVKQLAFADLRRQVAMVSQETYIFIGTIAENIAYGCPDATHEQIVRAAQIASAHDFIVKCPDGYDTLVGAGLRDLSGGERQRISIARAVLANPRILILDEATAAMDTETERNIQNAIDALIVGRTAISIAHRLSTLRNADSLVVLEDGKIVEQGTHIELIKQKGTYYTLVQLQNKALAMREMGG